MHKFRKFIAASAIASVSIGGLATASGSVEAGGGQWFDRTCSSQTGDREFDRQLCRQRFVRDLNNWGGLTVHSCWSSTVNQGSGYYNRAGCYVTW